MHFIQIAFRLWPYKRTNKTCPPLEITGMISPYSAQLIQRAWHAFYFVMCFEEWVSKSAKELSMLLWHKYFI